MSAKMRKRKIGHLTLMCLLLLVLLTGCKDERPQGDESSTADISPGSEHTSSEQTGEKDSDGMEYDCTVHAISGDVLEMEKENMTAGLRD